MNLKNQTQSIRNYLSKYLALIMDVYCHLWNRVKLNCRGYLDGFDGFSERENC